MAGGISKGLGALLILVGILLLLAGIGAAGFGFYDQQENEKQLLQDPDRKDTNQMLLVGGGIGAGVGIILLVVGLLFRSFGKGRAEKAFQRELIDATRAAKEPAPMHPMPVASATPQPTPLTVPTPVEPVPSPAAGAATNSSSRTTKPKKRAVRTG